MIRLCILVILVKSCHGRTIGPEMSPRTRLVKDLHQNLTVSNLERPERIVINLTLSLSSLDLDFASGILYSNGWIGLQWNDERISWDPKDYGGLTSQPVTFFKSWVPELDLYNAVDPNFTSRHRCVVRNDKLIAYVSSFHAKTTCAPNYEEYPFGIQTCQLKFGSFVGDHYKIQYGTSEHPIYLKEFISSVGWKVLNTNANIESSQYLLPPLLEEPSPSVVLTISIKKDFHFNKQVERVERPPVSFIYKFFR